TLDLKVSPPESDIKEPHTKKRKLNSQAELSHGARGRPADGLCPQVWPFRAPRRDHDPGRLPPWPAGVGGLRPAMAADRAVRGPPARKHGRYGHRDATMILVGYRHGLRASEVCDLQWQQIELSEGRLHVHPVKNGIPSVHPIRGDEMRALRKLRRDYPTDAYVFVSERGGPISPIGFHRLVQRLGEAAKMPFPIHPHMLRHACGFKLANDGHDTRALQHYLGHKNIQHTVRYTEMAPDRFKDFWSRSL